ncbi:MAG: hypothetical protein ACYDAC_05795 [Candidatus Dormibacteria bacterium]
MEPVSHETRPAIGTVRFEGPSMAAAVAARQEEERYRVMVLRLSRPGPWARPGALMGRPPVDNR